MDIDSKVVAVALAVVLLSVFLAFSQKNPLNTTAVSLSTAPEVSNGIEQKFMGYTEEFLKAFEEEELLEDLLVADASRVKQLIMQAPKEACLKLEIFKEELGFFYHVDDYALKEGCDKKRASLYEDYMRLDYLGEEYLLILTFI